MGDELMWEYPLLVPHLVRGRPYLSIMGIVFLVLSLQTLPMERMDSSFLLREIKRVGALLEIGEKSSASRSRGYWAGHAGKILLEITRDIGQADLTASERIRIGAQLNELRVRLGRIDV
jgi:hypothetical protein